MVEVPLYADVNYVHSLDGIVNFGLGHVQTEIGIPLLLL